MAQSDSTPAETALRREGPLRALGLMSGTSYDAIDVAAIEADGAAQVASVGAETALFHEDERALIENAITAALEWGFEGDEPPMFAHATAAITAAHARAVAAFLNRRPDWTPDIIGFHGQTVLHRPPANRPGATLQLGDAQALADLLSAPVVFDFRSADIAAGGHGAPLAPIYHWALAARDGLGAGTAILNLGGVANVTFLTNAPEDLVAFDTGPANGLLDAWVTQHGAGVCDEDGRLAQAGAVSRDRFTALRDHRHFDAPPPKSLDRFAFSLAPLAGASLEDGCATLTAFTAWSVARALAWAPQPVSRVLAAGGGVRNPVLMAAIAQALPAGVVLDTVARLGWDADALEAELMAYLAVRSVRGLPLSFPKTTGVDEACRGGRLVAPRP